MKTIKYRVWAKVNECYLDMEADYFYLAPDGTFYEITQLRNGEIDYNEVRADIQFYTGLKDRNNKEIYEGDIVKLYDIRYTKPLIGKVCFNTERGRWMIYQNVSQGRDLTAEKASKCEIVGNIYENSELLK